MRQMINGLQVPLLFHSRTPDIKSKIKQYRECESLDNWTFIIVAKPNLVLIRNRDNDEKIVKAKYTYHWQEIEYIFITFKARM